MINHLLFFFPMNSHRMVLSLSLSLSLSIYYREIVEFNRDSSVCCPLFKMVRGNLLYVERGVFCELVFGRANERTRAK